MTQRALFLGCIVAASFFSLGAATEYRDKEKSLVAIRMSDGHITLYRRHYYNDETSTITVSKYEIGCGEDVDSKQTYHCFGDDQLLVSDSGDYFALYNAYSLSLGSSSGKELISIDDDIASVYIDEGREYIVLGTDYGSLKIYSLNDLSFIQEYTSTDHNAIRGMRYSNAYSYCALIKDDYIECINLVDNAVYSTRYTMGICKRSTEDRIDIDSVCFSEDERFMFAYCQGLVIWDLHSQRTEPCAFFAKPFCSRFVYSTASNQILAGFPSRSYSFSLEDNGDGSFVLISLNTFLKDTQNNKYFMYGEHDPVNRVSFLNSDDIKDHRRKGDIVSVIDEKLYKHERSVYERPHIVGNNARDLIVTVHERLLCLRFWNLAGEYLGQQNLASYTGFEPCTIRTVLFSDDDRHLIVAHKGCMVVFDITLSYSENRSVVSSIDIG